MENINKKAGSIRVLLVPLDWGLGHATRCIPIISTLLKSHVEVMVAGEGEILEILEKAHPGIVILPLKGYRINYSRHQKFFFYKLLFQLPKILSIIKREHSWLKKIVQLYKIDGVISDNRFGLHNPQVETIFITHQLFIETGESWLNNIAQKINYNYINKFNECWIPDYAGESNAAGKLSHPLNFPRIPVKYLGILSRFIKKDPVFTHELIVVLSGPEPQRTIFENILLPQLEHIPGTVILVRGLPLQTKKLVVADKQLIIYNYLAGEKLNELINQSRQIVARSGYSTIMDLLTLQRKAVLVPTAGQGEQEYLAEYLLKKKLFFTSPQKNFRLTEALSANEKFAYSSNFLTGKFNEQVIEEWIEKIKKKVNVLQ